MRERDVKTAGGLVIVVIAVLVAAWLLGDDGDDGAHRADEAARESSSALDLAAAASGAGPADAERAPESLPAPAGTLPVGDADTALPGESLVITGRVVDAQGRGLDQALVIHWPIAIHRAVLGLDQQPRWGGVDWTKFASTRTDADGRFTLATRDEPQERVHMFSAEGGSLRVGGEPAAARPRLLVEREDYATDIVPVPGAHDGVADAGEIVLQAGATLTGRTVDADGAPLARMPLAVGNIETNRWSGDDAEQLLELRAARTSGADGRFRIPGLPAGPLRLHSEPEGYAALEHEATLAVGEVTDVGDLVFGAGGQLSGRVVDVDGRPVPGAELLARYSVGLGVGGADQPAMVWSARVMFGDRMLDQTAKADAEGRFTLTGLLAEMPNVNLLARAPGFDPALEASVQAGSTDLLLRLRPQASWRVSVTDATGAPLPGAAVEAWRWDEAAEWSADCEVVPEGARFVVRGAGLAATKLRASAPGHAPQLETLPALKPGEVRETTLQLAPGCSIAGRVVRDDGQRLARAAVRLQLDGYNNFDRKVPEVRTDADGRFRFVDVEPGAWTLRARATGCLPVLNPIPVEVREGGPPIDVEITLPRGGRIAGVLRDAAGAPVAGALVTALTRDAAALAFAVGAGGGPAPESLPTSLADRAFTDRAGRFTLLCLPPGAWELDGDEGATAQVSVAVGETAEVELTRAAPPAPPQLRGRVLLAGQPLAGAVVELGDAWAFRFDDTADVTATTGPDGAYELTAPGDGKHQLRARDAVGPSAPQPVELEWGRVTFVDIVLPGGRVTGRVVERGSGEPLADVRVQLALQRNEAVSALGGDRRDTQSGRDGSFDFQRVPDGEYKLTAGGRYCVPPSPVTLQVRDGEPSEVTIETEIGGSVTVVFADPSLWLSMLASVTPVHGTDAAARGRSEMDGKVTLGPVPAGDYDLVILRKDEAAEHVVRRLGVTVVAGETLRVKEVEDG